jgi:hypothetical protein
MKKRIDNFDIIITTIIFMITSSLLIFPTIFLPVMASSHNSNVSQKAKLQSSTIHLSKVNQKPIFNGANNTNDRVVIITFGDGYQSQYDYAKPVLDKYGFKANFFVTCNRIGTNSHMTWQEIEQLYKEGHVIGSKTMDYGTKAMQNKDLNHLSTAVLEYEVSQSKQCLLNHGISTTFFAVPKNIANDNATVINTIAKYYSLAINGHSNLMYLHCDGWKQSSNQTDCRTYSDDGTLTFANRYSIREWSMQHLGHGNSFGDSKMFEKFVAELNSQNKFNQNDTVNAIPIIGYHRIVTYPDLSYSTVSSDTTLNLFNAEMKYLHDNGFKVITFYNLGYDDKANIFFIKQ